MLRRHQQQQQTVAVLCCHSVAQGQQNPHLQALKGLASSRSSWQSLQQQDSSSCRGCRMWMLELLAAQP
jgi:hypothetical protein